MVSERPTIDVRWETAIGMLLDGLGKTRIAASLDPPIHRNTVTNWTRDPRFRRMLQERLDERDAEVRLRRAHTTTRFASRVYQLAERALVAAEGQPTDRGLQRVAVHWMRLYRRLVDMERAG